MNKILLTLIACILAINLKAQMVTDIYTVQQDPTLVGREVAVVGIVTASPGIFDLRRTFMQDQEGGPWSGIAIWDDENRLFAEIGDMIRVIGIVNETNGLTEIQLISFYIFSKDNILPDVEPLATADIAAGLSITEPFESMIVQVNNVTVVNESIGYGEWLVDDGSGACRIGDDADNLSYEVPESGTEISSITGILNFNSYNFMIEPRFRSDIVDVGSSLTYTIPEIQQDASLSGDTVTVSGIVTAATGVFQPDKAFIEEPDGGIFSGVLLSNNTVILNVDEGDEVKVTGILSENDGMTEIQVISYDVLSTGNPLPPLEIVNTGDISFDSEGAELYESVLIQVKDVYISENNLGDGEWEVNSIEGACLGTKGFCRIDDEAENLIFEVPPIGSPLLSITGILVKNNNYFKLEPRYRSDINEVEFVPIGDTLTIIQRPLLNIPSISRPGDTLEIICQLSQHPSSWSSALLYENQEIGLAPVGEEFDADKNLWKLKALLPANLISELYDLELLIPGKNIDVSKHSVQIIPQFKDEFYFIHITDTHLPTHFYCRDDDFKQDSTAILGLRAVIEDINLINPAFVLHTGDLINEGELEDYLYSRYYTRAKQVLLEFNVPLYLVPGNHDLGGWTDTPMPDGTARRDWWRFFGWKHLNAPSGLNPQYTQDYSFRYGNCHFTGLEAYLNYDMWRSETYGSKSFIAEQLDWLQQNLNRVDDSLLKILFYHFDFSNNLDLEELDVDLALWGHTHKDSYTPGEYPISISTDDCSNWSRAYRLIRVKGDSILPSPTLHAGDSGENLDVVYLPDNNGLNYRVSALVTNNLNEHFEHAQLRFVMPKDGKYPQITGGSLNQIDDSGDYSVFYVDVGIDEKSTKKVTMTVYSSSLGPFADQCKINYKYMRPGTDTLTVSANIVNPENHTVRVRSLIESIDLAIRDTIDLFDDGKSGDSTAGDGTFTGRWLSLPYEKEYSVHISTITEDSLFENLLSNAARFTTIGPIKFDSLYIAQNEGDLFRVRLVLKNGGLHTTASSIKARIELNDPLIEIEDNYQTFGDIPPGETVQNISFYSFFTNNPPDSIQGKIDIFSNNNFFWSDSFAIGFISPGISEFNNEIPSKFALKQNYPNPFNSSTTIEFSIPRSDFVTLKIYNLLGQEAADLMTTHLTPGNYKYNWDASSFASGIYYYTLTTGSGFIKSYKLTLVR